MKEIFILGVGHNTPVYIDLVEACGYTVAGLYHYDEELVGTDIHGYQIIGSNKDLFSQLSLAGANFALSMGDNSLRLQLADKIRNLGGYIPRLIHPSSIIQKFVTLEEGVIIHANCVVQSDAFIGHDTVISYNVGISHNTKIDFGCYIACQSIIGAYVNIKTGTLIGVGCTVASGKVSHIGPNAIVGAGSVVTKPVEENAIVVGNPARLLIKK